MGTNIKHLKTIAKNDKIANVIVIGLSLIVFLLVGLMRRYKLDINFGFDTHVFPAISAAINSIVALLLILGLVAIKKKNYSLHKSIMLAAVICSVLFLITYVLYHFTTIEAAYGGELGIIYYPLLLTHIVLAGVSLPFILYTVYRGLTGEYARHKKLTRYVWPVWFYVSVTGVVVYFMISPYY